MKHSIIFAVLIVLLTSGIPEASAVPADPKPARVTLSDGTQITIRTYGDEFYHYVLSDEGYTLANGKDGDYYYATLAADGTLVPTSVKARPFAKLTTAERAKISKIQKGIKPTAVSPLKQLREIDARKAAAAAATDVSKATVGGNIAPGRITSTVTTGKRKWPIILVQFPDVKFTISNPVSSISNLLNQPGYSVNGSTGSAWDYYNENSDGQFDPEFVVYGPYTASQPESFYAGKSGTENVGTLVIEICDLADKDINFTDFDAGGVIQDVILFYAGYNQAEHAPEYTIWPHCSNVIYRGKRLDGLLLAGYGCFSELRGSSGGQIANIGTFCHEFGHIMGWPDFYDTGYGPNAGTEDFSLMCSGSYNNQSRTPPPLNILERWMMGWASPEELTASGYNSLAPITDSKGYLMASSTPNEYFLAEYRGAGENEWDNPSHIGGKGLIVYHVDNTDNYSNLWERGTPNSLRGHECMKLVRSVPGTRNSPMETFFPGSTNVTVLSASRNSQYITWKGNAPFVEFEDIEISGNRVNMNVREEGTVGPNQNFKSTTYQYSALLSWRDGDSESWEVSWNAIASSVRQSKVVRKSEIYIENLKPETVYEVTITPSPGGAEKAQTYSFTTAGPSEGKLRIVLPDSEITTETPVPLAIADYDGTFKQIEWYIDGTASTSSHRALKAGERCITAVITAEDGTKEYLIKYITVK